MTDEDVRTIEKLLDKKLSQNQEGLTGQISELSQRVDNGFAAAATTAQIDAVAKHLQEIDEELGRALKAIDESQDEIHTDLDRIERRLNHDFDRLDDHGTRIERLEAKTAHLPAPPRSRQ